MDSTEVVYQCFSALSAAGSLFVLVSCCVVHPSLARHRLYHPVAALSFSQLLFGIAGAIGFPPVTSTACTVRGILWVIFLPSSFMWNCFVVMAVLQETALPKRGCDLDETMDETIETATKLKIKSASTAPQFLSLLSSSMHSPMPLWLMHAIVWTISLGFFFVSLGVGATPHHVTCRGYDRVGAEAVFAYMFGVLTLSLVAIAFFFFRLRSLGLESKQGFANFKHILWYPFTLLTTWLLIYSTEMLLYCALTVPSIVRDSRSGAPDAKSWQLEVLLAILSNCIGIWHFLIFVRTGKKFRQGLSRKYSATVAIEEGTYEDARDAKLAGDAVDLEHLTPSTSRDSMALS